MQYTVWAAALFVALIGHPSFAQQSGFRPVETAANSPAPSAESWQGLSDPFSGDPARSHLSRMQTNSHSQIAQVSGKKAFALSLLLPGLGHRHVHGGDWDGWASVFAVADVSLWASLLGSEWRRNHLIDSYTTLAARHADAQVAGKERDFFLNLAAYMSSDEYTEVQLRNRNWAQVDYAADPAYQWSWESQSSYSEYRSVREDAESLRRRRSFIITSLVANRLIAGFTALRAAGRVDDGGGELSLGVPPAGATLPLIRLDYRF